MKGKTAIVYGVGWMILAVPSLILLIPDVPAIVLIFTLGLGMITFPIPTFFVYYTAAGVGVALRAVGVPTWIAAAFGALSIAATAAIPGVVADGLDSATRLSLQRHDTPAPIADAPRQVRLVLDRGVGPTPDPLRSTPCEALCQTLLFSGEAHTVIVQAGTERRRTFATAWRRESLPACPPAFARADDALPAVARAATRGDCLVNAPAADTPAEPWLHLVRVRYNDDRLGTTIPPLHRVTRIREVTAGGPSDPFDAPTFRHTEVEADVIASPTVFIPKGRAELHVSLVLWRHTRTHGETSWEDAARRAFGHTVRDLDDPGDATVDDVRALLDTPGTAAFDDAQQVMIASVLRARPRRAPITPDEAALFDRLLRDPRVDDLYFLGDALEKNPDTAVALLPAVVARLNLPVPEQGGHTHSNLAFMLRKLPIDALRPHGPALLTAVEADGGWGTAPVLALLPQLVEVPDDVWEAALTPDSRQAEAALLGLCNAPAEVVTPHLDRIARVGLDSRNTPPRVLAYKTMQLHGRDADADAIRARVADHALKLFDRQVSDRTTPDGCTR